MADLFHQCAKYFGTDDLYAVLSVKKNAQDGVLKRAYHKLSLKVHPDRVGEDEKAEATKKFQTLGKVYSILSDKDKRAVYDESGEIDEQSGVSEDRDWYSQWRSMFNVVTVANIKDFENKYRGTDEETNDLIKAYMECEGDMQTIIDTVLCATTKDEDRFREILMKRIKEGEIPDFDKFTKESGTRKSARRKKAAAEAEEAEELSKELGLEAGGKSLKNLIVQRQKERAKHSDDFFAQLEEKYAPTKKKAKTTTKKPRSQSKKKAAKK